MLDTHTLWLTLGLSLAVPATLTVILLFVTGIPTIEQSADRKWGGMPECQDYRRGTSLLIPWTNTRGPGAAGREGRA